MNFEASRALNTLAANPGGGKKTKARSNEAEKNDLLGFTLLNPRTTQLSVKKAYCSKINCQITSFADSNFEITEAFLNLLERLNMPNVPVQLLQFP